MNEQRAEVKLINNGRQLWSWGIRERDRMGGKGGGRTLFVLWDNSPRVQHNAQPAININSNIIRS